MKYVNKLETPQFFLDNIQGFTIWDDYNRSEQTKESRRNLRRHLLEYEQFNLCIYCESRITLDSSHIEHVKPKDENLYPELTFEYKNLAASCQGRVHAELTKIGEQQPESTCGHKKSNEYNEELFLCPHTTTDINSYFKYCKDTGILEPHDTDNHSVRYQKAKYMMTILKLNEGNLPKARLIAITVLKRRLRNNFKKDKIGRQAEIQRVLQNNTNAFISFLRYYYQ